MNAWILITLLACGDTQTSPTGDSGPDADVDTDTDTDTDTDCNVDIDDMSPEDNENGVYYRSTVQVWLDGDDETAAITVTDENGNSIDGTTVNEDGHIRFTPSPSLVPDTTHSVSFTWCGGEENLSFETSELGAALEIDLTDQTFALDLGSATWIEPAGIGDLVGGYLDMNLLVGVQSMDAGVIDFIGAMGEGTTTDQDMCLPTIDFEPGDFSEAPYFTVGPADMPVALMGYSVTVFGMGVSGTFAPDGDWMGGVELKGAFDIAEIGPALGGIFGFDLSDPDVACGTIALLGINCGPCPHKDEEHCLALHLTNIEATNTGDTIQLVEEAYCDEACDERAEHPECDEGGDIGL
jgi:hypothetical protein